MKAAKSAGMKVVMVPNVHVEMNYDETDMVLKSLLEFKPEDFGLPPFENAFWVKNKGEIVFELNKLRISFS